MGQIEKIQADGWLGIRTINGFKYIQTHKIIFLKAENKRTTLFFNDNTSLKANHLLKYFQEYLNEPIFVRCHYSYIVNCMKIDFFSGNEIVTILGNRIPIARGKMEYFKRIFSKYLEVSCKSHTITSIL